MNTLYKNDDLGKLIIRLGVGILMLFHGIEKLAHLGTLKFIKGQLVNFGWPELLAYGVYIGEIVAPLLVIFGVYTRFGGLLIVVNMIFAILLVHAHEFFALTGHGGWALELQALYLLGGLVVLFLGSGKYAFKPD